MGQIKLTRRLVRDKVRAASNDEFFEVWGKIAEALKAY